MVRAEKMLNCKQSFSLTLPYIIYSFVNFIIDKGKKLEVLSLTLFNKFKKMWTQFKFFCCCFSYFKAVEFLNNYLKSIQM